VFVKIPYFGQKLAYNLNSNVIFHTYSYQSGLQLYGLAVACWMTDHYHPYLILSMGHIWRVFHLWLHFITFGGCSAHLAYHVDKSGRKTSFVIHNRLLMHFMKLCWYNNKMNFQSMAILLRVLDDSQFKSSPYTIFTVFFLLFQ